MIWPILDSMEHADGRPGVIVSSPMTRLGALLLLTLLIGAHVGLIVPLPISHCAAAEESPCTPSDCLARCPLCVCSLDRPAASFGAVVLAVLPAPDRAFPVRVGPSPPLPQPRDILHVPKSVLA